VWRGAAECGAAECGAAECGDAFYRLTLYVLKIYFKFEYIMIQKSWIFIGKSSNQRQ